MTTQKSMGKLIMQILGFVSLHVFTEILHFVLFVIAAIVRTSLLQSFDPIKDFKQSRKQAHAAVIQGFKKAWMEDRNNKP